MPESPADRHRRWRSMLTDRDWARLEALTAEITSNRPSLSLQDLDCPLRIAVCEPGYEGRLSGERIGTLKGFPVVVWELNNREREAWGRK